VKLSRSDAFADAAILVDRANAPQDAQHILASVAAACEPPAAPVELSADLPRVAGDQDCPTTQIDPNRSYDLRDC
jgi:hypothetical protein